MIEAHVREWCEQIVVEVVLATGNSTWRAEQLGALLSPMSFTAALYRAISCMQRFRSASARSLERRGATPADRHRTRRPATFQPVAPPRDCADERAGARRADGLDRASNHRCAAGRTGAVAARPRRRRDAAAPLHAGRSGSSGSSRPVDGHRDRGDDLRQASRRGSSSGRAYQSGSSTGPNRGGEARRARRPRPSDPVASAPAARGRASVPALSLLGASGAILCPRAIRGHIFTRIGGFLLPPGHGYQWHSCHKKCWICRQNMHRRP